ncbi:MAG: hypothetical protein ABSE73_02095 [Planctomycetota bacterium]
MIADYLKAPYPVATSLHTTWRQLRPVADKRDEERNYSFKLKGGIPYIVFSKRFGFPIITTSPKLSRVWTAVTDSGYPELSSEQKNELDQLRGRERQDCCARLYQGLWFSSHRAELDELSKMFNACWVEAKPEGQEPRQLLLRIDLPSAWRVDIVGLSSLLTKSQALLVTHGVSANDRLAVNHASGDRQATSAQAPQSESDSSLPMGSDAIRQLLTEGAKTFFQPQCYALLCAAYIDPQEVFDRLRLAEFTGREWLRAEVDAFLRKERSGYFVLNGYGGIGKTAFVADLARKRGYVHHFAEQGRTQSAALSNLAVQLARAWQLEDKAAELRSGKNDVQRHLFYAILKDASKRQRELRPNEKIVVVVDALNEAERPAAGNVLGLPERLPDGIYFVVSQQPGGVPLAVGETRCKTVELKADGEENLEDVRSYLETVATSPQLWPGIAKAIRTGVCTQERFVQTLTRRSQGLWLYLHHVIYEIEQGQRSIAQLDDLPFGVWQYYVQFWDRWSANAKHASVWGTRQLRLLGTLAAVQEPVTFSTLCALAHVRQTSQVRWLLEHSWRRFIIRQPGTNDTAGHYRLYHDVFRHFLEGRVEENAIFTSELQRDLVHSIAAATRKAHSRIATTFITHWNGNPADLSAPLSGLRDPARRDVHGGYGLRHLATHLRRSDRQDDLFALIGARGWYEANESTDVSLAGYLKDLAIAWDAAAATNTERAACGELVPLLAKEIQCALITDAVKSCSSRVPADVVLAFVESGKWTPAGGLNYALRPPAGQEYTTAIVGMMHYLPPELQRMAFQHGRTAWGTDKCAETITMAARMACQLPEGELKALLLMLTTARASIGSKRLAYALAELADIRPIMGNDGIIEEARRIIALLDEKTLCTLYLKQIVKLLAMVGDTKTAELIIGLIPDSAQQQAEKQILAQHVEAHASRSASCDVESEINTRDDVEAWFDWPASLFYNAAPNLRLKLLRRAYEVVMRQPSDVWPCGIFGSPQTSCLPSCLAEAGMWEEAIKVIKAREDDSRVAALAVCRLATYIPPKSRSHILNEAWADLTAMTFQYNAQLFIRKLVRHLGSSEKQVEALKCLQTLSLRPMRGAILIDTLPILGLPIGSELEADAVDHACGIRNRLERVRALNIIIPHLQGKFKKEAELEAIQSLDKMEASDRAISLLRLCGRCANPDVRRSPRKLVAELRNGLGPATDSDWKLRDLALDLIARRDIETAELVVECIRHPTMLLAATCALLPCLPPARAEARAKATLRLAWSEDKTVSSISREVVGVVQHLGVSERVVLVEEMLGLARRSDDPKERTRLFTALHPCFRDDTEREAVRREALSAAHEVKDVIVKGLALARLACCCPLDQRQALMKEALSMIPRAIDAQQFLLLPPALDELMAIVSESARSDLYPMVNRVLHSGSHPQQYLLFTILTALVPILVKVAGAEASVEICAAVNALLTAGGQGASPGDMAVSSGPPSAAPTATTPRSSGRRLCAGSGGGSTFPIKRASSSSNGSEVLK